MSIINSLLKGLSWIWTLLNSGLEWIGSNLFFTLPDIDQATYAFLYDLPSQIPSTTMHLEWFLFSPYLTVAIQVFVITTLTVVCFKLAKLLITVAGAVKNLLPFI